MAGWTKIGDPVKLTERTGNFHYVLCECSCGARKYVQIKNATGALTSGSCRSCATKANRQQKHWVSRSRLTHGHAVNGELTPTYVSWMQMIARCERTWGTHYDKYGANGIRVCERWQGDTGFQHFLDDMGERPVGTSIDRFPDQSGNYEPGNCRWATSLQQGRNRRNNRLISWNGHTATLAEWEERTGIRQDTLRRRLLLGWSVDAALSTPTMAQFSHPKARDI